MKKLIFPSEFMHFSLLVLTYLQAEYPEIFECFLTILHISEHIYQEMDFGKLSEYSHMYLDFLFKS